MEHLIGVDWIDRKIISNKIIMTFFSISWYVNSHQALCIRLQALGTVIDKSATHLSFLKHKQEGSPNKHNLK
jgi:hypothetical protein